MVQMMIVLTFNLNLLHVRCQNLLFSRNVHAQCSFLMNAHKYVFAAYNCTNSMQLKHVSKNCTTAVHVAFKLSQARCVNMSYNVQKHGNARIVNMF